VITGNALIKYDSPLIQLPATTRAGLLASQMLSGWSSAPATLSDRLEDPPQTHPCVRANWFAVSVAAGASGLSWQAAGSTNTSVVPGTAVLQIQSGIADLQTGILAEIKSLVATAIASLSDEWLSLAKIGWENETSVFTQIDDDRERRAALEADRALSVLPPELGGQVHRRLQDLIAIARDEGLETAGPAPDSVRAAVAFLAAMSADARLRVPSITLDSDGLVVYEWRTTKGESAVLRFLIDGMVGCALTTAATGRLRRPNTWFGIVSADEIRRTVVAKAAFLGLMGR
jgi:hypothetical protein